MPTNAAIATDTDTLADQINALETEFTDLHGDEAFNEYYIRIFNKKPSMLADTFNRSAHPYLIGLFLSVALNKEKHLQDTLIDSFTGEAEKPWEGQRSQFTHTMRDTILYDLQDTTDKFAYAKCDLG